MKLKEAMKDGYLRTGRHNELVREALRDHWSKVGPKLLEALEGTLHEVPTSNTAFINWAKKRIAEAGEVEGI